METACEPRSQQSMAAKQLRLDLWGAIRTCLNIFGPGTISFAIDHRTWNTGLPVRSAVLKPCAGRLVVGWVTTSEYLLLIVLHFLQKIPAANVTFSSGFTNRCALTSCRTETATNHRKVLFPARFVGAAEVSTTLPPARHGHFGRMPWLPVSHVSGRLFQSRPGRGYDICG